MKTGVELIATEREEQIVKHGKTIKSDVDLNRFDQLSIGAAKLAKPEPTLEDWVLCPRFWDTDLWDRMLRKPYKDRLVIAGALIAAEIDRLQAID